MQNGTDTCNSELLYSSASQPASKLGWLGTLALVFAIEGVLSPFHALFRSRLRRRLQHEVDWGFRTNCGGFEIRVSRESGEKSLVSIHSLCEAFGAHENLAYLRTVAEKRKDRVMCLLTGEEAASVLLRIPESCGYAFAEAQVGIVLANFPVMIFASPQSYCTAVVETMAHEAAHLLLNLQGGRTKQADYLDEMACSYLDGAADTRLLECVAAYTSGVLPQPSHILQVEQGILEFRLVASAIIGLIVNRIGIDRLCDAYLLRLRHCYAPLYECFGEAGIESPHSLDTAVANHLRGSVDRFKQEQIEELACCYRMKYAYEVGDWATALGCSHALSGTGYELEALIYRACTLVKMQEHERALDCVEAMLERASHPVVRFRVALLNAILKRLLGSREDYPRLVSAHSDLHSPAHLHRLSKRYESLESLAKGRELSDASVRGKDILHILFGIQRFLGESRVPRVAEK